MEEDNNTYNDQFKKPSIDDYFKNQGYKKRNGSMDAVYNATSDPLLGTNTGYGESKYDKSLNWFNDVNQDDIQGSIKENRAQNQGWGMKAGAGLGRVAAKVVAEVAKMPGMIGGVLAAPFVEDGEGFETAFNNSWIKSINELNEDFNSEVLPVYVKKAVQEGNLWDNVSSIDFWATEGADGIGYIASMMVPGAALKGLGVGNKLSNLTKSLGKFGISATKADVVTATLANTLFEAGAEAGGAMENFQKEMDSKLSNGLITQDEYDAMKVQKARLGRDIFLSNSVILLGPNALQANMLWGKGISKTIGKTIGNGDGIVAKTIVEPKLYQKVLNRGKDVLSAGSSEGLWEEGMQMTVENMFTNSAKKGQLKEGYTGLNDFNLSELGNAYLDTITTTEGQKAMFLGAFLGGGMQAYHGAKSDINDRKPVDPSILEAGNNTIDAFYTALSLNEYNEDGTPNKQKTKEKFEAFGHLEQLNTIYNDAVESQDKEVLEKLRDLSGTQLAYSFVMQGLELEALQENLEASSQFDEIVQREQEAGNKTTKKEIIAKVMTKAESIKKAYDSFNDFAPSNVNPELKENQTEENKQSFINLLRGKYISNKANIQLTSDTLDKLQKQQDNILQDLGFNKNSILDLENYSLDIDQIDKAKDPYNVMHGDERLKKVREDIKETSTNLERLKKLDRNFWNKEHLQKAFDRSTKEKEKLEEETSTESQESHQEVIDTIVSHENIEDFKTYWKNLDPKFKDNPAVSDIAKDKTAELLQKEDLQKQMAELEAEVKDQQTFAEDSDFGTTTSTTTTTKAAETTISNEMTTLQSSENAEVDNENNVFDKNPLSVVNLTENTNPENSEKNQGAARVISTYQETGDAIPGLEKFVEFEKTPRDKTKDKVTFSLGDVKAGSQNKETKIILDKIKNGETVTEKEITALKNYLPIKVTLTNGKNSASSFLDSMSHPNPDIVARETLPLRNAIVDALIDNEGDFKGIEGSVAKQFTGELKIGEPSSNVLELDVFKGMTEKEKITYFKKNTVYVSNKGVVKYAATDAIDDTKSLKSSNKGEVFLRIPMINGEIFYLKLNTERLSQDKASAVLQLIKLRSNILNKKEELTSEDLQDYISSNGLMSIQTEFDFIKRNNDNIYQTLDKLINFVVFAQNTNAKTKLILGENGTLALGELLHKVNAQIPEWSGQLESYTYTNDTLNNLNDHQNQAIIEYLKYKRHNVLITKDDTATFNNEDYLKYMLGLNSDYPILTTNAVVNEPTFQGYSNIYLNQSVTNKSAKKEVASEKVEVNEDSVSNLLDSLDYGQVEETTVTNTQSDLDIANNIRQNRQKERLEKLKSEDLLLVTHFLLSNKGVQNEYGSDTALLTNQLKISFKEAEDLVNQHMSAIKPDGFKLGDNYDTALLDTKVNNSLKDINAKYDVELANLEIQSKHELIGKEIEAKEPTTKELIKGNIISVEINKIKKGQFRITLDNNEIVAWNENNPTNFTWVKKNNSETKVEKILEPTTSSESIFKKATEEKQLEMLEQALLATNKTLDDITSDDLELEFNKLIEELRKNNKISEINKICG